MPVSIPQLGRFSQVGSGLIQVIKTATAPTPTQVEPDDLTEERPSDVPVVDFIDPQAK